MYREYSWLADGYSWDYVEFCEYVSRRRSSIMSGKWLTEKHIIVLGHPAQIWYGSHDISMFTIALIDGQLRVLDPVAKIASQR